MVPLDLAPHLPGQVRNKKGNLLRDKGCWALWGRRHGLHGLHRQLCFRRPSRSLAKWKVHTAKRCLWPPFFCSASITGRR